MFKQFFNPDQYLTKKSDIVIFEGEHNTKMSAYNPKIVEHFMHPRNVGEIPDADGVGTVGHPACGDVVRIYIKVSPQNSNPVISQVQFKTFGCTTAIATSSIATELIK